jgi:hypothetical protein
MILDIPTKNDFYDQGFLFLNFAWDIIFDLLSGYKYEFEELDKKTIDECWLKSQAKLAKAVALSQQGAEFLLKGKISEVSPFLLLSGSIDNWPKKCDKNDTLFSEFRTTDAQDLIKIHDTVAEKKLSENFTSIFNRLRKTRNSITHTINKRLFFDGHDIVVDILNIATEFIGKNNWIETRKDYIKKHMSDDGETIGFILELDTIVTLLEHKELIDNFNFSKKNRRYYCPYCCEKWSSVFDIGDLEVKSAQLQPNTPESTNLYCFFCRRNIQVQRTCCVNPNCQGNVINPDMNSDYNCLTCLLQSYEIDEMEWQKNRE